MAKWYYQIGLVVIVSYFYILQPIWANDPLPSDLSKGYPDNMAMLSPLSYAPVEARRIKKARLLWMNYELLSPEAESYILDAWAYAVPQSYDPPGTFGEQTKTFYSDAYGGSFMNGNLGSGRAASVGKTQTKGIGPTPMVGPQADHYHKDGGVNIYEALMEAIWGEVFDTELPFGANRVLALIETGTFIKGVYATDLPRALVIREDPLRPAHFLTNESVEGEGIARDQARVNAALPKLLRAFAKPQFSNARTTEEEIHERMLEFTSRLGRLYATYYARSLLHGAASPSNIEVTARALDYGTATALDGFSRIILADDDPHGDTFVPKHDILLNIFDNLRRSLSDPLNKAIPTKEEIDETFDRVYQDVMHEEFLKNAGLPAELVGVVARTPSGDRFASMLLELSKAGNVVYPKLSFDQSIPEKTGTYNLGQILIEAADASSREELEERLRELIADPVMRSEFERAYIEFRGTADEWAEKMKLRKHALERYFRHAAKMRNRPRPDLFRGHRLNRTIQHLLDAYHEGSKPEALQRALDRVVDSNITQQKDLAPFEVLLYQSRSPKDGFLIRNVYQLQKDRYETKVRFKIHDGKVTVGKRTFRVNDFLKLALSFDCGTGNIQKALGRNMRSFVEFTYLQPALKTGISKYQVLGPQGEILASFKHTVLLPEVIVVDTCHEHLRKFVHAQ